MALIKNAKEGFHHNAAVSRDNTNTLPKRTDIFYVNFSFLKPPIWGCLIKERKNLKKKLKKWVRPRWIFISKASNFVLLINILISLYSNAAIFSPVLILKLAHPSSANFTPNPSHIQPIDYQNPRRFLHPCRALNVFLASLVIPFSSAITYGLVDCFNLQKR